MRWVPRGALRRCHHRSSRRRLLILEMPPTENPGCIFGITLREWLRKIVTFIVLAVVFGWIFATVSPRMFPSGQKPGFAYGLLHGGLMPMALPSLVTGRDVEIFASNNSGRGYKIGYICGINLCGLIFFGSAFWSPKKMATP